MSNTARLGQQSDCPFWSATENRLNEANFISVDAEISVSNREHWTVPEKRRASYQPFHPIHDGLADKETAIHVQK